MPLKHNTFSVRCFAGEGSMIGSVLENDFGRPLTKREATKLCNFENERSARRRAQKLPYAFDYCVHSWRKEDFATV